MAPMGSLPGSLPHMNPCPGSVALDRYRPPSSRSSTRSSDETSETSSLASCELGKKEDVDQRELKLGLGCVACILTLLEGIIVVYNVWDLNVFHMADLQSFGVPATHYFSSAQRFCLKVLGVGDLLLAFLGAFGFWSERNVLLALVFESLRGLHAQIATNCLKSLLIWRVMVAILAAPFLGITLAFQPTHMTWHYCLAFIYLATSVGVSAALIAALGVVTAESRLVQLEFELEDATFKNRRLEFGAKEPLILGKLPWGPAVFLWIAIFGAASFVWSVRLWMTKQCVIGGWAVFVTSLSFVSSTHWLEMIVYNVSWVLAIVGISGIMMFNSALSLEALVRETLGEPQENPIVRRNLIWELERAIAGKWQGTAAVCTFFVFSLLRIGFFFPITGMALFEKNICGFYIEAVLRQHKSIPLFCTPEERRGLILMVVFFILDLYQLSGLYKVWCHYYHQCEHPQDKLVTFNSYGPSYGTGIEAESPPPPESHRDAPLSPVAEEAITSPAEEEAPEEQEDGDILNPNIAPLPANFILPLDSFRKLSAGIYPVPILSIGGDALLHACLPSTPQQGYAVGGRGAWLELMATERSKAPHASIGPLPRGVRKRRAAEIWGRAGENYGEFTPVVGGWEVRRRGRTLLVLSTVDTRTMEITASLPDGNTIATTSARDNENLGLYVDAGNDTLLVLLCVLAVILMSPRPQMLTIPKTAMSPMGTASSLPAEGMQ